jgi:Domain of unknown function (DUF5655)/Domain of unknown function (DUF4287)
MSPATKKKTLYSVHPGVKMVQNWIEALPEKTGRTLEQWLATIRKDGPKDTSARREWLKKKHGLGTNSAWWLADRVEGMGLEDGDPKAYLAAAERYVEAQYAGKKSALRPLYDALLDLGLSIAKDVQACPCKTMVPLYRNHVFAEIKPTTLTRIDLGLALKNEKTPARLVDTGGFQKKDRITRRIPITSTADIDAEVKRWLKVAYAMDA